MYIWPHAAISRAVMYVSLFVLAVSTSAHAQLIISRDATSNMSCSQTECDATQDQATLNVKDITDRLKSSNLVVKGRSFMAFRVLAPIAWKHQSTLSFTVSQAPLSISAPITVKGRGGVSINELPLFFSGGSISFAHTSGIFRIGNTTYKLVSDLKDLAKRVRNDPEGNYALANDYDAGLDGTYKRSPITQPFGGSFEGLGHSISNLKISSKEAGANVGLFASIEEMGDHPTIADVGIVNASIKAGEGSFAGILIGDGFVGWFSNIYVSGSVSASNGTAGGLAGSADGAIVQDCMADVTVSGSQAGGLVSHFQHAEVTDSVATGTVTATGNMQHQVAGGLVAQVLDTSIKTSYAAAAESGDGAILGGLIGANPGSTLYHNNYWDTTISGDGVPGCGGQTCNSGVTGLTTSQLQSGLPDGFSDAVWGQSSGINNGMPYPLTAAPR